MNPFCRRIDISREACQLKSHVQYLSTLQCKKNNICQRALVYWLKCEPTFDHCSSRPILHKTCTIVLIVETWPVDPCATTLTGYLLEFGDSDTGCDFLFSPTRNNLTKRTKSGNILLAVGITVFVLSSWAASTVLSGFRLSSWKNKFRHQSFASAGLVITDIL